MTTLQCNCGCTARFSGRRAAICPCCGTRRTTPRNRSARSPWSAVKRAMITGWTPGDSYVWVGRMPVPVTRQAWSEMLRLRFLRPQR